MKKLFVKQKYIETVYEDRHIVNLNEANIHRDVDAEEEVDLIN